MLMLTWTDVSAGLPDDDILVLITLENSEVWPGMRAKAQQLLDREGSRG